MQNNQDIIRKMYNVLLHRDPDPDGFEIYLKKLNNNVPMFKIIQAIASSKEFLDCQLKLIKSNTATSYELSNYIVDYENDISQLTKNLSTTNELFEQNCLEIQHLQKENQRLKALFQNNDHKSSISILHNVESMKDAFTQTDHECVGYTLPVRKSKLIHFITQKINVFMCVRNNEYSLKNTFDQLLNLQTIFNLKLHFYIYENDSTDNTPFMIIDFFRNHNVNGSYKIEKLSKKEWKDVQDTHRSADMAMYRNTMKNLCKNFDHSDYSIILDTDVEFTSDNFQKMIKILKSNCDVAMVTPYAYAGNTLKYYDTYALDSPINVCVLMPEIQQVNSAFGGFVLIRTHVLEKCNWDVTPDKLCSEHNYFCQMVRNYGKVIIARDIRVHWRNKFT